MLLVLLGRSEHAFLTLCLVAIVSAITHGIVAPASVGCVIAAVLAAVVFRALTLAFIVCALCIFHKLKLTLF